MQWNKRRFLIHLSPQEERPQDSRALIEYCIHLLVCVRAEEVKEGKPQNILNGLRHSCKRMCILYCQEKIILREHVFRALITAFIEKQS